MLTKRIIRSYVSKAQGKALSAIATVKETLLLGMLNLEVVPRKETRRFARLLWDVDDDVSDDELYAFLKRLRGVDILGEDTCFRLYDRFISARYFRSAQYVKEMGALKTSYRNMRRAKTADLFGIIQACVYRGDTGSARQGAHLLMTRELTGETLWKLNELRAYISLLEGDSASAQKIWEEQIPSGCDVDAFRAFKAYCTSKSIAIVGPAQSTHDSSREIDAHDIVVRINHFGSNLVPQSGEKTNVVYYNGEVTQECFDEIYREMDGLDFGVLRGKTIARLSSMGGRILKLPLYDVLFHAGLMGIQRIFLDLIRHAPKSITLYNIDFYTGQQAYAKEYIGAGRRQTLAVNSLQRHDLVQNFLMMKQIYDHGLVAAESSVSRILALSKEGYIEKLSG